MARFVHLAPAEQSERIRRNGLKADRKAGGVFAMAVVADYMTTYSWSREMARHRGRLVAVQFRIADGEPVRIGHYAAPSETVSAAQAVGIIRGLLDARGFEILVPRAVRATEITHIRRAPRVGWRYSPSAKGTARVRCPCPVCRTRGEVGEAAIRRGIIDSHLAPAGAASLEMVRGLASAACVADELGERTAARRLYRRIQAVATSGDAETRQAALEHLVTLAGALDRTRGFDPDRELALLGEQLAVENDPRLRRLAVDTAVARAVRLVRTNDSCADGLAILETTISTWEADRSADVVRAVEEAAELAEELRDELAEDRPGPT